MMLSFVNAGLVLLVSEGKSVGGEQRFLKHSSYAPD